MWFTKFKIRGIIKNELNENFIAIYGYQECHILELNLAKTDNNTNNNLLYNKLQQSLSSYRKRHKLELGLDFSSQQYGKKIIILKIKWINNLKLLIITNMFIRIII